MPLEFYKLFHIVAILLIFSQLGITVAHAGQLLLFVTGFGMLAKLGIMGFPWPAWVWVKLVIWLVLGGSSTWIHKMPERATMSLFLVLLLGTVAAFMALYKSF